MPGPARLTARSAPGTCLILLALAGGCRSTTVLSTLEAQPRGEEDEVLSWDATATCKGPTHLLRASIDTDPANLMGWSRTDVGYRVILDVSVAGPGDTVRKTVFLPVTEKREVGREGDTIKMAYDAAGTMTDSGFRRGAPLDSVRFVPLPGPHRIDVRLRIPEGGNRRALRVIRTLRVDVVGPEGSRCALTEWSRVEDEAR